MVITSHLSKMSHRTLGSLGLVQRCTYERHIFSVTVRYHVVTYWRIMVWFDSCQHIMLCICIVISCYIYVNHSCMLRAAKIKCNDRLHRAADCSRHRRTHEVCDRRVGLRVPWDPGQSVTHSALGAWRKPINLLLNVLIPAISDFPRQYKLW